MTATSYAARVARWGRARVAAGTSVRIDVRGEQVDLIGARGPDAAGLGSAGATVFDLPPRESVNLACPASCSRITPTHCRRIQRAGVVRDLFFAGHTHGGQVCLPGRHSDPATRHAPRRYCSGVHRLGDSWLVVSRGMGLLELCDRVFCPAEVGGSGRQAEG
jgi:hypothetical protein